MPYKSILVPLRGADHDAHAVRIALRIAQRYEAHVDALYARPSLSDLAPVLGAFDLAGPPPGLMERMEQDIQRREASASQLIPRIAGEFGAAVAPAPDQALHQPSISLTVEPGALFDVVGRVGEFYDLIVQEHEPEGVDLEPFDELLLEAALIRARRPAFLAPKLVRDTFPSQVSIAWSGSVEGMQAVSAALPFLADADNVHIIRDAAEGAASAGEERLVQYLGRHGIIGEIHRVSSGGGRTSAAILDKATELQTDLLVMGGFTHGPTRQSVFGGVTRDMLRHAPLPILMAH